MRFLLTTAIILGLGLPALVFGLREARYHQLVEEAQDALTYGDEAGFRLAMTILDQRYGLRRDVMRLEGDYLAAQGSADSIRWRKSLYEEFPGSDTRLAYGITLLQFNQLDEGFRLLNEWDLSEAEDPNYLRLAGSLHFAQGNFTLALNSFQKLHQMDPDNPHHHINLCALKLRIGSIQEIEDSIRTLKDFQQRGVLRGMPAKVLLEAGIDQAQGGWIDMAERWIWSDPYSPVGIKRKCLLAFRDFGIVGWEPQLDRMITIASMGAETRLDMLQWMTVSQLHAEAFAWMQKLDSRLLQDPELSKVYAELLLQHRNFKALLTHLKSVDWTIEEYLRYAYLAHATEQLRGRPYTQSNRLWDRAFEKATLVPRATMQLADRLESWENWKALQDLIEEQHRADPESLYWQNRQLHIFQVTQQTDRLFEAFENLYRQSPENLIYANNYAALGLLLGRDQNIVTAIAQRNYQASPGQPDIVTTYVLTLMEHQPEEALIIIRPLLGKFPQHHGLILYYGECLRRSGKTNTVIHYYDTLLSSQQLMPEEKAFLAEWKEDRQSAMPASGSPVVTLP